MISVFYNSAVSTHYFYNKKLKITLKKILALPTSQSSDKHKYEG